MFINQNNSSQPHPAGWTPCMSPNLTGQHRLSYNMQPCKLGVPKHGVESVGKRFALRTLLFLSFYVQTSLSVNRLCYHFNRFVPHIYLSASPHLSTTDSRCVLCTELFVYEHRQPHKTHSVLSSDQNVSTMAPQGQLLLLAL
jgi:hypothetical protein